MTVCEYPLSSPARVASVPLLYHSTYKVIFTRAKDVRISHQDIMNVQTLMKIELSNTTVIKEVLL